MTAFDRLDVLDARVSGALDEIAAPSRPDYLDDIFQVTARTRQRPRWTFLERWLPMGTAISARAGFRRVNMRPIVLFVVIALLAIAAFAVVSVGSRNRAAPPFGPASNGLFVYGYGGDLYVRDTLAGEQRLLIGGPGVQGGVIYSLDGQLIAYDNTIDGIDKVTVAGAAIRVEPADHPQRAVHGRCGGVVARQPIDGAPRRPRPTAGRSCGSRRPTDPAPAR